MRQLLCIALASALAGCGGDSVTAPTEQLAPRHWIETVQVEGEIKSAANTPLTVPGIGWESRQLLSMVEDGSFVKKGDVIATFDAPTSRMELSQAEMELLRKGLMERAVLAGAAVQSAELGANTAKVNADLLLSERYGDIKAENGVLTRNQILDALQDTTFLKNKRAYLGWKRGQVDVRAKAERAVVGTQIGSITLQAGQRRASLAALQLTAPHDGVFVQSASWDGSKVKIGANVGSGSDFGVLPDATQLIARFSVPEARAHGIKIDQLVRARLAGSGSEFTLKVTRISSNASAKSSQSPVKYSEFDAAIAPAAATSLGLTAGQAVRATVVLVDRPLVLTLPNLALVQEGEQHAVYVGTSAPGVKKAVQLGQRGGVRSEIKSGLAAGERILLLPPADKKKAT